MDTIKFAEWLATLGVGGVLAAFIFTIYRKDIKQYTELWKATTDELVNVVKENTVASTRLVTMLENHERNELRKGDIETIIVGAMLKAKHGDAREKDNG